MPIHLAQDRARHSLALIADWRSVIRSDSFNRVIHRSSRLKFKLRGQVAGGMEQTYVAAHADMGQCFS